MYNPFDRSAKMAPSHYPRLVFHGLRTFQLVSSVIVGGIMSFFIWHLTHDHWSTPWTFIWVGDPYLGPGNREEQLADHCMRGS